ncbi:hypothetical protein [Dyella sp.]|jgi:hypothetical protein|uniref:hypothetical protein n=1 Tax=Dyella sp. TaxID=1869338 RepID=UPI002D79D8B0|nr:hypothetical protein [Dyella sp.]HET6432299.1 hypothetical protein [Dyella sp.]
MNHMDPQWFSWRSLCDEWSRKDLHGTSLRVLTLLVVLWLAINPSLLPLAAWVDSVGIESALALLEMQLVVGVLLAIEVYCPRLWPALADGTRRAGRFFSRLRMFVGMYVRDL